MVALATMLQGVARRVMQFVDEFLVRLAGTR